MIKLSGTFFISRIIIRIFLRLWMIRQKRNSTGLYEIRVESGNNIYRVFCFFDKGQLIILLNGTVKKSQKIRKNEIKKAERLKKQYYDEKED